MGTPASILDLIAAGGGALGSDMDAQRAKLDLTRSAAEQNRAQALQAKAATEQTALESQQKQRAMKDLDVYHRAGVNTDGSPKAMRDYMRKNGITVAGLTNYEKMLKETASYDKDKLEAANLVHQATAQTLSAATPENWPQVVTRLQELHPDQDFSQYADFPGADAVAGLAKMNDVGAKIVGQKKTEQEITLAAEEEKRRKTKEGRDAALFPAQLQEAESKAIGATQKVEGTEPVQELDQLKLDAEALNRDTQAAHQRRMEDLTVRGQNITAQGQGQQNANQKATLTNQLRDDLRTDTKNFQTISQAYGQIQQAKDGHPVSDIALMYAYMKMLDPNSVVREGEYATAQNAGGLPAMVINQYNKLIGGGKLSGEVRGQFLNQAERVYGQSKSDAQQIEGKYREIAQKNGLDPGQVIIDKSSTAEGPKKGDKKAHGANELEFDGTHWVVIK